MKKTLFCLALISLLSACQAIDSALTTSGNITEKTSAFDEQRTVSMTPAMTGIGTEQAKIGLFWQADFGDTIVFSVKRMDIDNFSADEPLLIRVDGETYELAPFNNFSSGRFDVEHLKGVGVYGSSTKNYVGNKDIVSSIVNGSKAAYRIPLSGNRYADGEITYKYRSYQSYVPQAFQNFLEYINN